ncbi:TIGR03086 family metal-binding protein [Streptomyces sp. NBC_01260]|uniref:TIGR03086 family metal-binding protein n=1 Tax=unclassified Streptomyces TaxID=2593676 RepID=UPI002257F8F3|nr:MULTISPECIES: TIGR03086 family metal-binding protein [unclassified Streptomyces]MCX4768817.1 TIGR03086 family metal-binding protein [Streptomyces sp. NBC_01285]
MDIVQLDRAAVLESVRIVESAGPADWDRPTPCSRWTLRRLVEHMGAQHLGFAAASRGEGAGAAVWETRPAGDDPAARYREAADAVLEAFAEPGVLERRFALPEIDAAATFAAATAIGFHFIDYVVHSWDAAASLGMRTAFPPDVVEAALPIALRVPGGERRERPGAAFRPALPCDEGAGGDRADTFRLVLSTLGRSPDWSPPQGS